MVAFSRQNPKTFFRKKPLSFQGVY